jgi:hypothetical protein
MASAPTENEQVPQGTAPQNDEVHPQSAADAKAANKKDVSLKEFLSKMDDYAPIVSLAILCSLCFCILCRLRSHSVLGYRSQMP